MEGHTDPNVNKKAPNDAIMGHGLGLTNENYVVGIIVCSFFHLK